MQKLKSQEKHEIRISYVFTSENMMLKKSDAFITISTRDNV